MRSFVDRFGIITVSLLVIVGIFVLSGCSDSKQIISPNSCAKINKEIVSADFVVYAPGLVYKVQSIKQTTKDTKYTVEFPDVFYPRYNTADFYLGDLTDLSSLVDCSVFEDYKQKNRIKDLEEKLEILEDRVGRHYNTTSDRLYKLEGKNATKR